MNRCDCERPSRPTSVAPEWPWWSAWWKRWRVGRNPLGYMRTLAARHDPVYEDAFRKACIDVLGEDPYDPHYAELNDGKECADGPQ